MSGYAEQDGVAESLEARPVVCCTTHDQVASVCAGLGGAMRVAYVQLPYGSLDVGAGLAALRERGLVDTAITVGAAGGGDVACVTTASALAWAAARAFDALVCAIGRHEPLDLPPLAHPGVAAAEAANAASALAGSPILVATIADGVLAPETQAALGLCLGSVTVAWPQGLAVPAALGAAREVDPRGWREACTGLHVGDADDWCVAAAFSAGRLARALVQDPAG